LANLYVPVTGGCIPSPLDPPLRVAVVRSASLITAVSRLTIVLCVLDASTVKCGPHFTPGLYSAVYSIYGKT